MMDGSPLAADATSFHRFHADLLPARIAAGNGALAFADLEHLGTLAVRTPAGSWTYVPRAGSVELLEGEATADAVVAVDLDAWLGLVSDLDTAPGLFYTDRASVPVGNPLRFMRWEPGLRALFHGLPVFDPDSVDLRDLDGGPLDTTRSFTLGETGDTGRDGAAARHFLRTAGYLHVPVVFDADEVAAMLTDADILAGEARPGDMASWWGRDAAGTEVLTRVLRAASRPDLRLLVDDARIRRVVDTADEVLVPKVPDDPEAVDLVTVLWKRPDMAEGLADLPWHRDCGMGGHALNCPSVVLTICLTTGTPEAGELRFLPGSHRGGFPFVDGTDVAAPDGVGLPIGVGDVTLHYSDLMHASLPPTSALGPHRISVLLGFAPETAGHHLGGRHYNDALLVNDDGQVDHLGHRLAEG
jgi:ectoine hydroxylase-related dioxygenase (phytanoyl-CoA dioxygenase family)